MGGMVSKEFREIQRAHCLMAPCKMNGDDWMKKFVTKLLQISHAQWVYRNYTLHESRRGYLALKDREKVLTDIRHLMDTDPDEVPESSRYLLELDFTQLSNSGYEQQAYWVVAVKAARQAGRRAWVRLSKMGSSAKRRAKQSSQRRTKASDVFAVDKILREIRQELGLDKVPSRRRPAKWVPPTSSRPQKRVKRPN